MVYQIWCTNYGDLFMTRDSDVTLHEELNNVINSRVTLHHYRES